MDLSEAEKQTKILKKQPVPIPAREINPVSVIGSIFGEVKHCIGITEKVIRTKEGRDYTKLRGCSYLFKGYVAHQVVELLDISKRASWIVIDWLEKRWVQSWIILTFLFSRKIARKRFIKVSEQYLGIAWKPLQEKNYLMKGKTYCESVSELYRESEVILDVIFKGEGGKIREMFSKFRDIGLMIPQFDMAYRYPSQDILPEINVENLKKNPIKEMQRVFNILVERDPRPGMKKKWRRIERNLIFVLRWSWILSLFTGGRVRVRQWFVKFFSELDYEKIEMDEADWYYCLARFSYNYKGISFKERMAEKERIDKEKGHLPGLDVVEKPYPHIEIPDIKRS